MGIVLDKVLMDYLLICRNARSRLLDVHVHCWAVLGMNDRYFVEGRVRVAERLRPVRGEGVGQMHIKMKELWKKEKMVEYQKMRSGWKGVEGIRGWRWRRSVGTKGRGGGEGGAVEGGPEVCRYCKVGVGMRKDSEWWNDSTKKVVE